MKKLGILLAIIIPLAVYAVSSNNYTYIQGPSLIESLTTTATAAGTTTLTVSSNMNQQFTGVTTQTVKLPVATTLQVGKSFYITNRSTGNVSVQYSDASAAKTILPNSQAEFVLVNNGTAVGSWDISIGAESIATSAHNFLTGIATTGVVSKAQPACTDLSDASASCATDATNANNITAGLLALANGGTHVDLSATGGTSQVLQQASTGAGITVARLACADLSNSSASCSTDATNASNIGSGTLALARGGTNANLSATGGTSNVLKQVTTGAAVTVGQLACADLSNASASCATDATNASNIGSGTLPAGRLPNPSATTLGGVESLAAVTNNFLTSISTSGVPTQARPTCSNLSDAAASCATDATNATNIGSGTLPAARLPNPSASTLGGVESLSAVSHNFLTSISTSGVPTQAQPVFADISGNLAVGQLPSAITWPATGTVQAITPSNHGVLLSGAGATATVLAPDASTSKVLTSGGSSADPTWATVTATSPTASEFVNNLGIATSVAANALTISLKQSDASTDPAAGTGAVTVGFRNATAGTGSYTSVSATAAQTIVVPSGATLGHTSGVAWPIYLYAINNAGALEMAVSRTLFIENTTVSTTTIGAGSTAGTTMYSTTGRAAVAYRLVGKITISEATAGTWLSNATKIELLPFEHGMASNAGTVQSGFFSAQITGASGAVSGEVGGDWINGNCTQSTGTYGCTINGAIFSAAPNCVCTPFDTGGICLITASSSTSVTFVTASAVSGTVANHDIFVMCQGLR